MPQLQSLVGEILVLYLLQPYLAIAAKIFFKLLSLDEREVAVDVLLKSLLVADEIEDGEEDD